MSAGRLAGWIVLLLFVTDTVAEGGRGRPEGAPGTSELGIRFAQPQPPAVAVRPQQDAATHVKPSHERGYHLIRNKAYNPPEFDQQVFEQLWKVWPEPLRSKAAQATPDERRTMALSRYGLMPDPRNPRDEGPGLGYTRDSEGGWRLNCFACHAGKVAGRVIPGLPNSHFALQTLTADVRLTKLAQFKKLTHMDLGSLKMPLGTTNGTTNSVMFGVALGALRTPDMRVDTSVSRPEMTHHDMDAPPFWNVRKKDRLYIDGFAPKYHRLLLQFLLVPSNDAGTVKGWEDDFRHILAWIESVEAPEYPWSIDRELAARGKRVFNATCARCHGTYGENEQYPEKRVPVDVVGTDPVRLNALTPAHRRTLKESWMSRYGEERVVVDPGGYVAPPLDGIWASAPYFHNGSVPTLWHVLHPDDRPAVWKRTEDGYDRDKVGLEVSTFEEVPGSVQRPDERRQYFDTTRFGKSAAGHRFPDVLGEAEKRAVLEYLRTL